MFLEHSKFRKEEKLTRDKINRELKGAPPAITILQILNVSRLSSSQGFFHFLKNSATPLVYISTVEPEPHG